VRGVGPTRAASNRQAGFGLLSTVVSLLIVALLSLGALKTFAGGASTGSGSGSAALSPTVAKAYDIQAQSALSNAMQNLRDNAVANGGLSGLDLESFGVTTGPSRSSSVVSGADSSVGSGRVTLAVESKSQTCWFAWFSTSDTWFGVEPDASACVAQPLSGPPTPGPGSSGTVGWQEGSFPTTG